MKKTWTAELARDADSFEQALSAEAELVESSPFIHAAPTVEGPASTFTTIVAPRAGHDPDVWAEADEQGAAQPAEDVWAGFDVESVDSTSADGVEIDGEDILESVDEPSVDGGLRFSSPSLAAIRIQPVEELQEPPLELTMPSLDMLEDPSASGGPQHPSLAGQLGAISITQILQLLAVERQSGILTDTLDDASIAVELVDGRVVGAQATGVEPWHLLAPAEKAISVTADQEALRCDHLRRVRELVYRIMLWDGGQFGFTPRAVSPSTPSEWSLEVNALLLDGAQFVDEWHVIQGSIPAVGWQLRRTDKAEGFKARDALEGRILDVLERGGPISLVELSRRLGKGTYEVGKCADKLVRRTVLSATEPIQIPSGFLHIPLPVPSGPITIPPGRGRAGNTPTPSIPPASKTPVPVPIVEPRPRSVPPPVPVSDAAHSPTPVPVAVAASLPDGLVGEDASRSTSSVRGRSGIRGPLTAIGVLLGLVAVMAVVAWQVGVFGPESGEEPLGPSSAVGGGGDGQASPGARAAGETQAGPSVVSGGEAPTQAPVAPNPVVVEQPPAGRELAGGRRPDPARVSDGRAQGRVEPVVEAPREPVVEAPREPVVEAPREDRQPAGHVPPVPAPTEPEAPKAETPPSEDVPPGEPEVVEVEITSNPMGAIVLLGGAPAGQTPLSLTLPRSSRFELVLRKEGYVDRKIVWGGAKAPPRVGVTLEPALEAEAPSPAPEP